EGMKAIKGTKGRTIAQNEATCIVYGMPKAVVDAGLADKVVPLTHIAGEILNMI
ncbi:MAG: chemotaxis response regulator protein-glutamate methylesterase, partial [Nitrospirae bacterium]|nr:chemotaxis response regulator protein-glutamate methylesterase [Nitrospirota bacterium]